MSNPKTRNLETPNQIAPNLTLTFAALSDVTRLRVIETLRRGSMPAGALATEFAVSPPMLSKHLKVLRAAGLVAEERDETDARLRVYRLNGAPFTDAQSWLDETTRFWRDQLDSFAGYVASTTVAASGSKSAKRHKTQPLSKSRKQSAVRLRKRRLAP